MFDVVAQVDCAYDASGTLLLTGPGASSLAWIIPESEGLLPLGMVDWSVQDEFGCVFDGQSELVAPEMPTMTFEVTEPTCFGASDGAVSAQWTGGVDPQVAWPFNPDAVLAGSYVILLEDVPNCSYSIGLIVGEPE